MSRRRFPPPFSFQQIYNFYDEVYPLRGADDLWIDTVHHLMQCQVSMPMSLWIIGRDGTSINAYKTVLGIQRKKDVAFGIRYSDLYASEEKKKMGSRRTKDKLVHPLTTMNEILAWAFEVYLLPHPKMYLNEAAPAKEVWSQITKEYSEVIKRNGGKPDKETYTRTPLFPIEIMEWGREGFCGSRSKEHQAERKSLRVEAIRKYRAAHGEKYLLLP